MKKATTEKTTKQTGPLNPAEVGQFAFRDGVWYLTPALKTAAKATP